jgi:hypothetical protein
MRLTTRQRPVRKTLRRVDGGPLDGYALALNAETNCTTAWLALHGKNGRYVNGRWEDARC